MGRQKQTNPDDHDWALSPQQEAAVALLSIGRTVTETAAELGVARQTVSEWANQHLGFRVALNQRRWELWAGLIERLRVLLPKALGVLEKEIDNGGVKASLELLKMAGIEGLRPPPGAVTIEDAEVEAKEAKTARLFRALGAGI